MEYVCIITLVFCHISMSTAANADRPLAVEFQKFILITFSLTFDQFPWYSLTIFHFPDFCENGNPVPPHWASCLFIYWNIYTPPFPLGHDWSPSSIEGDFLQLKWLFCWRKHHLSWRKTSQDEGKLLGKRFLLPPKRNDIETPVSLFYETSNL